MPLNSIGIRDAKINLSKLLKRAKSGQDIIITDRGKPVGKIVAISTENLSLGARIKKLEEQGVLGPQTKMKRKLLPPPISAPDAIAQKYLQEDRNT